MQAKLKDILTEYKELNSNSLYEPVAIGKYGLRKRDEIYKKDISSDYSKNKVIRKNTLTIGMGSNQIDIGVLFDDEIYSVSPAYHTFSIDANVIEPKYLDLMLKTKNSYYFKKHSIVTVRQGKKINLDSLFNEEIDIPSFEKQAQIIDKIKEISNEIYNEKVNIAYLDTFIKSRFNELFSNETTNVTVNESCEVHARIGWQALTQKEHMKEGTYMLITGTDFENNEINYSNCVFVSKERYEMDPKIILKNDDVLITKDGTIGKVAIVHNLPGPATLNSGVFVIRPDRRFNKEYISYVFKGEPFSKFVEEVKTGVTIKHLNQQSLLKFSIPVPSIERQNEFASFVELIDKLKFNAQERIKLYQELLDKKMDEYFN